VRRRWEDRDVLSGTTQERGDDNHPNQTMAYLTACTFYAAMFERSPEGLPVDKATDFKDFGEGKDADGGPLMRTFQPQDRADLQRIAWEGFRQIALPFVLPRHPDAATVSTMEALLQAGLGGRVPAPPEKRYHVNYKESIMKRMLVVLTAAGLVFGGVAGADEEGGTGATKEGTGATEPAPKKVKEEKTPAKTVEVTLEGTISRKEGTATYMLTTADGKVITLPKSPDVKVGPYVNTRVTIVGQGTETGEGENRKVSVKQIASITVVQDK